MPLKIFLSAGEKVFINGAVLESVERNARIVVHNAADILRQKDILMEEDVRTPAQRIYFCVQCLYIAPSDRDHYLLLLHRLVSEFEEAAPSSREIIVRMSRSLIAGEFYKALKAAKALVQFEADAFAAFQGQARPSAEEDGANAGAPPRRVLTVERKRPPRRVGPPAHDPANDPE